MTRVWTPEMDETVRREYPTCGCKDTLAAALGVTRSALVARSKILKVRRRVRLRRPWSGADKELIRTQYGKIPTDELARRLGRPPVHVWTMARKLGVQAKNLVWTEQALSRMAELNGLGWTDSDIAREFKCDRHAVSARRKAAGLPCHASHAGNASERVRDKIRQGVRRVAERTGVSPGERRRVAHRRFARENGWPETLRPRQVQILNLLAAAGTPLSREQIATACGMPWKGRTTGMLCNGEGTTYLSDLMRRDLVVTLGRIGKPDTGRRSSGVYLYTLGPKALAILQERANAGEQQRGGETVQPVGDGRADAAA